MHEKPEISQSEWQVMNVVWRQQPVPASEIIKALSKSQKWTAATIRTFLHRLVKKGALEYEAEGNRYLYQASVTRNATIKQASKSFMHSVFDGRSGPMITHFVKSSRLSPAEIEELRSLLDQKDSG